MRDQQRAQIIGGWRSHLHCRSILYYSGSVLASSVLLWSGLAIAPHSALAVPRGDQLLAQGVVDSLPPPPTVTFGEQALPLQPSQPQQTAAPSRFTPANSDAETFTPSASQDRYLVFVNGDSSLLLEQVQRIEADAFLRTYDGRQVIQAGIFGQEASAESRVAALESQGIGAEVVEVDDDDLRESSQPAQRTAANSESYRSNAYYVVIPGQVEELAEMRTQVALLGSGLGANANTVQQNQEPLGPHVSVGPFVDRDAAERWNRYLRDFGMNARVYYRR